MAVAFRSKSTLATSTSPGGTWALASGEPSGAAENDILIAYAVTYPQTTTRSTPTGWTPLYSRNNNTDQSGVSMWWIRRGGSAPSLSITLGGDSATWIESQILCYSGCKTSGDPWNVMDDAAGTADATPNPEPPPVTTTVANCVNVIIGMGWAGCAGGGWSAPAGYTSREVNTSNNWSAFDKLVTSATTETPAAITNTTSATSGWDAVSIALEPEGGGPSNAPRAAAYYRMMRTR